MAKYESCCLLQAPKHTDSNAVRGRSARTGANVVTWSRFRVQKSPIERDFWYLIRSKSGFWGRRKWPQASRIRRPQVRRAGVLRKNGSKRTVYSKNSIVKNSRGLGAGAENRSPRGPRGMAVRSSGLARIALFGFSRSNRRKPGHGCPIQVPKETH